MDAQNQGSGWVHGDVPTGRKNRAVPGLRLQEEREQLSTDSAQWLGQRRLEASQPRLRPQTQGSPRAGAESAALTGGRASRDPCEDTRGSGGTHGAQGGHTGLREDTQGSGGTHGAQGGHTGLRGPPVPTPEPQNREDFVASRLRTPSR